MVFALIETESQYKATVTASDGVCKGLMQVNESAHQSRMEKLGVTDLYNPYQNVAVGIDYLAELFEKYEDVGIVLMAYNGGEGYAHKMIARGIYETEYCQKIFKIQERIYWEEEIIQNKQEL